MCNPIAIGMIMKGASTAIQSYGDYEAAQTEANVAEANAKLADRNAADARQLGADQAGQIRGEGTKVVSEQRAQLASNGVDVSSGSALNLFSSTRATAELDALTAKSNAARKAWGYDLEASTWRARETVARRRSILGPLAGGLGFAGDAIGGMGMGGGGGGGRGGFTFSHYGGNTHPWDAQDWAAARERAEREREAEQEREARRLGRRRAFRPG